MKMMNNQVTPERPQREKPKKEITPGWERAKKTRREDRLTKKGRDTDVRARRKLKFEAS